MVKFYGETAGNLAAIWGSENASVCRSLCTLTFAVAQLQIWQQTLAFSMTIQSFCVWEMANTASTGITQKDRKKSMNKLNFNIQYWHQRSEDIAITLPSQMSSNDSQKKKQKTVTSSASLLLGPCLGLCRWPQAAHIWQQLPGPGFQFCKIPPSWPTSGCAKSPPSSQEHSITRPGPLPFQQWLFGSKRAIQASRVCLNKTCQVWSKFDKKSLHFFKAEWLLGSIYIPSTMRKGMLKTKFLHLLPRLQLYIHDTWSHLRLHWNRIPPPSHMKFVRRWVSCGVTAWNSILLGHRGWKFYGTRDQEKNNDSVHAKCDQSLEGRKIWDSSKRHRKNLTECHANGKIQNIQAWQSPLLNIPASDPHPGNPLKRIASWWQKLPESVPIWLTSLTGLTSGCYGNCSSRKDRPWV